MENVRHRAIHGEVQLRYGQVQSDAAGGYGIMGSALTKYVKAECANFNSPVCVDAYNTFVNTGIDALVIGQYMITEKPQAVDYADYIAMVDQNRLLGDYETKPFETQLIEKLLKDEDYKLIVNYGHFWLFKKISE